MASTTTNYIINERILAEWVDGETSATCTLGSCSLFNRHAIDLSMKVGIDTETGNAQIYISLIVDARVSTKTRKKEIRLIFLPHTFDKSLEFPLPFKSLQILDAASSSILQQSDLTNSGHIIRVHFNLASPGCVVVRQSNQLIRPATSTARNLIQDLKSLSAALSFNVYMRQSDYAKIGLQTLNRQLHDVIIGPSCVNLVSLFGKQRDAMFMDWANLKTSNQRHGTRENSQQPLPPPLYTEDSLTSPAKTHVPEAPPIIEGQQSPLYAEEPSFSVRAQIQIPQSPDEGSKEVSQHVIETVLIETPPWNANHDSRIPPTDSQTSHQDMLDFEAEFESIANEVDLDDEYYATLQAREASLDREAVAFISEGPEDTGEEVQNEIGLDEERYLRESSLAREDASTLEVLSSEFTAWLLGAITINDRIYEHNRLTSRLFTLGYYVRTRNAKLFHSTIIWCSTILFCDPLDSGVPELWSATNRGLIAEIANLIKWSNTFCRSPEMCLSHLRSEFLKLGSAARDIAKLACDVNLAKYRRQRAHCISLVFQEFGRLTVGFGGREEIEHGL